MKSIMIVFHFSQILACKLKHFPFFLLMETLFALEKIKRFRLERFHTSGVNAKRFQMVPEVIIWRRKVYSISKLRSSLVFGS